MRNRIPKAEARKIVLARRRELTASEAAKKSLMIIERLLTVDDYIRAEKIFTYIPNTHHEVDTKLLINLADGWGKSVFIPKLNEPSDSFRIAQFTSFNELQINSHDYPEPEAAFEAEIEDIDLIIVPCVAVSLLGQRIGYGGQYYDRLLKLSYAPRYTLAFEYQLFREIENDQHDMRIDMIITERRTINTRKN